MVGQKELETRAGVGAVEQTAVFLSHHHIPTDQCAPSYSAEGDDEPWFYHYDLLLKVVRRASFDFIVGRVAVLGRAALDDIGDINFLALEPCNLKEFVQKFSRRADEWLPLNVLVVSGGLSHEHDLSIEGAFAWDGILA